MAEKKRAVTFDDDSSSKAAASAGAGSAAALADVVHLDPEEGLMKQDLETLDVSKLTPLTPEIISRQATINIGTIGHVAHGKTTVVRSISGVKVCATASSWCTLALSGPPPHVCHPSYRQRLYCRRFALRASSCATLPLSSATRTQRFTRASLRLMSTRARAATTPMNMCSKMVAGEATCVALLSCFRCFVAVALPGKL